jgi:predicted HTH domain antitoxin
MIAALVSFPQFHPEMGAALNPWAGHSLHATLMCLHSVKLLTVNDMTEKLVTISARVRKSQAKEIQELAIKEGVDKSAVVRGLLTAGLQKQKLRDALELVRAGKVTIWKAAEMAELTYREMLELLRTNNIPFPLSGEELKREVEETASREQRGAPNTSR